MKILVADDSRTARMLIEQSLSEWGYTVVSASDGQEALEIFEAGDPPPIGIIDWEMPKLDGAALCRRLRSRSRTAPLYLILLTARNDKRDIAAGLESGADDYIPKPFDEVELKARVSVGRRVIELQQEMLRQERLEGVLETAGAVCHEFNQPLQIVSAYSEMLLSNPQTDDETRQRLESIRAGVKRLGELTRRLMNVTHYETQDYTGSKTAEARIIDLEAASSES
ncbi:MAG: response regulator [Spirochaetaceae bacterium]|nr:MAG: response regulator [Spirochaetaceae bacterium]